MFITVAETADRLGAPDHHVYYLLVMGYIEAIKVRWEWRVYDKAVDTYVESHPKRRAGNPSGDSLGCGSSGSPFSLSYNGLSDDLRGRASGIQGRRRRVEHQPRRSYPRVQPQFKSLRQLDLFD